jgi:Ca2+-binding RTX toxin-like protein
MNPASVFAQGGDTVSSTAATTVLGGDSGTTTFALSGSNSSVTGGAGYLAGSASSANSTLVGGTGGGSLTVGGGGTGSLVVAGQGTGTTTVTLAETTGGAEVATNPLGDAGTLVATLSSTGADSVVGGGGASTITGGGGHDVFDFVNGHAGGTEVIIGYTASDNIAFGGYGYSATNLPTENLVGSNDVITLSDGTVITLVNLGHKLFS